MNSSLYRNVPQSCSLIFNDEDDSADPPLTRQGFALAAGSYSLSLRSGLLRGHFSPPAFMRCIRFFICLSCYCTPLFSKSGLGDPKYWPSVLSTMQLEPRIPMPTLSRLSCGGHRTWLKRRVVIRLDFSVGHVRPLLVIVFFLLIPPRISPFSVPFPLHPFFPAFLPTCKGFNSSRLLILPYGGFDFFGKHFLVIFPSFSSASLRRSNARNFPLFSRVS